ncbi:hypothetical protein J6W78_08035 [bacterium]|nr:hypothetical protein [bacterium]
MLICRVSEYDCDYQHRIPGIITVTKGSRRVHYILTKRGLEKAEIKEGEPVAYNPETGTAVIKEATDSSIDIFTVDTGNGKILSSEIVLKPERTEKNGKHFFAFPKLLSGCVQNDGTLALLVQYENLLSDSSRIINDPQHYSEEGISVALYLYEKGDAKKPKRYAFPQDEPPEGEAGDYFWEEPKQLQCTGKEIYLFSEKNHTNEISLFYKSQPNWILSRINIDPKQEEASITDKALIVYDNIIFNYYSKKENTVYTTVQASEKDKTILRITGLNEGYELPEIPIEKEGGEFLFSETTDGKPLIFFVKTRSHLDEQRIELLPL